MPRVELSSRRLLLTDAGPLVALTLPTDQSHARCVATLRRLRQVMVTTWPAFTEASFLVWREMRWHGQDRLWEFVRRKQLVFADTPEPLRVAELMAAYRDVPMDLADATLVAAAEQDGHRRIFSLDSDFYVYRLAGDRTLDVAFS